MIASSSSHPRDLPVCDATVDLDEVRRRIEVICPAERRVVEPVGEVARRVVGADGDVERSDGGWSLRFRGRDTLLRCRLAARELRNALAQLGCRVKIARAS